MPVAAYALLVAGGLWLFIWQTPGALASASCRSPPGALLALTARPARPAGLAPTDTTSASCSTPTTTTARAWPCCASAPATSCATSGAGSPRRPPMPRSPTCRRATAPSMLASRGSATGATSRPPARHVVEGPHRLSGIRARHAPPPTSSSATGGCPPWCTPALAEARPERPWERTGAVAIWLASAPRRDRRRFDRRSPVAAAAAGLATARPPGHARRRYRPSSARSPPIDGLPNRPTEAQP